MSGNPWLLLCDAVDRSHAPDEWLTIDRNYSTRREEFLKYLNGVRIVRMTKDRRKHDTVGDVEVRITGRQAFEISGAGTLATNDARHRQCNNLERFSRSIGH